MSLPILVAMVVVGISAVVAAVHLSGGSAKARLTGADQAGQRFATDFPDAAARAVLLTEDGGTAFLLLDNGAVGIVCGIGDKFLTRIVTSADVVAVTARDDGSVSLSLRDFTWKGGEFRFTDADAASAVVATLSARSGAFGAREKA